MRERSQIVARFKSNVQVLWLQMRHTQARQSASLLLLACRPSYQLLRGNSSSRSGDLICVAAAFSAGDVLTHTSFPLPSSASTESKQRKRSHGAGKC